MFASSSLVDSEVACSANDADSLSEILVESSSEAEVLVSDLPIAVEFWLPTVSLCAESSDVTGASDAANAC
ncbi:hypothetical protein [Staphylococcus auricularis]|uniref:Uncharacterized protein n=1 Tax=Staphylococcus auricularis TaxID=29379 RepID=A0AAW7MCL9_9STAP|nr:hypothetical protein [Staphylococcus auricularis]MDN4533035.1 hypothetical protein [Staphylococcus auricularis]MDN4533463.1 hypothetical protein [Staphylococcus auricularis]